MQGISAMNYRKHHILGLILFQTAHSMDVFTESILTPSIKQNPLLRVLKKKKNPLYNVKL